MWNLLTLQLNFIEKSVDFYENSLFQLIFIEKSADFYLNFIRYLLIFQLIFPDKSQWIDVYALVKINGKYSK